jgi:IclR family transcriptional regulator, pca regulon regulatory protein
MGNASGVGRVPVRLVSLFSLCENVFANRKSSSMPTAKSTETTPEDRDFVTALARGLDVLNAFGHDTPEMTLSEIAQRTGLSAATVRRSLITFEQLGYVRRQGRWFVLAPKVLSLGANYFASMNLKEVAQHDLAVLVEKFHDAASLTVLDNLEVVYVAHVPSDQRVRHGRSVGTRLPAHATSTGLVLLAHSSVQHREKLLAMKELPAYTSRTPVKPAELKAIFARVLREDYVVARDTIEYGAIAIAVPVRDGKGRVVAALNCSSRTEAVDEDRMARTRLKPMQETARRIGVMLDRYPALAHSVAQF